MKVYFNDNGTVSFEGIRFLFRNFSGAPGKYNREGDRSTCIAIDDPDVAQRLADEGWNVRILTPRDPDDTPLHYVRVKVNFRGDPRRDPGVWMLAGRNRTRLDEESINALDYADINNVDITVSPYHWELSERTGVSLYLRSAYVTIEEDRFAAKYAEEEYPE